jgi:serine-type D-Ala-D-Ala carboxypeptidase (penicillin-binding protein 5/6)
VLKLRRWSVQVLVILLMASIAVPSFGARWPRKRHYVRTNRPMRLVAPGPGFASALVVDAESQAVLYQKSPDEPRAPASLTKMMTELITLEAMERGVISLQDIIEVPPEVRMVGGSRVRLRPGERLPLRELLHAMSIASANDAAATIACRIAGSQERFVALMNARARQLGMNNTRYASVHGLERSDQPGSITTARDQALLARTLLSHPAALVISSTVADTIRGHQIIHTTNRLLGRCEGVDGLKTGYTGKAGFCLVSTAQRGGLRVISVVLGARSNRRRFSESEMLLQQVFSRYQRVPVIRKGQDLGHACSIDGGSPTEVRLVAGDDVAVLMSLPRQKEITLKVQAPASLQPPVSEGKAVGLLQVLIGDSLAAAVPAVTARGVQRARLLDRLGIRFD